MFNEIKYKNSTLVNADSLAYMKTLPDNCIDLILTDPPYFKVKKDKWDNQWDNEAAFLGWLDDCFAEFYRLLKPSGSLYVFCGSKLASDTEILMRQRFKVLSHIVWAKPNGPWLRQHKEDLRAFFPSTERILFAEHYDADGFAKGLVGYGSKCQELKGQVFSPLIEYFKTARESLGISAAEINQATGTQMCSHWFSYSQWVLPNEIQYKALQKLFNQKEQGNLLDRQYSDISLQYGTLRKEYSELSLEFDELKKEYNNLRRPFYVTSDVPYTDVWTYPPVTYYKGKHPCEKPAEMIKNIINSSSRPGQVVADFFMGSGVTIKQSLLLDRISIGVELEEARFMQTERELKEKY
ncbi:site-specific DNA-methyltransferase (plasmid) [Orbus sturtevantii]|uniref:DNA-methyltransferase n=1 Tax=Orbus sturtevantii TaxID=3074109 RepID=UPI00370DCC3F